MCFIVSLCTFCLWYVYLILSLYVYPHYIVTPDAIPSDICLFLWRSILYVFDNCCSTYSPTRAVYSRPDHPTYIEGMTFEFLEGRRTDEECAKINATTQLILFFMSNLLIHSSVCEELKTDYGIESIMAFLEKNSYNNALLGLFYYSYGHALTHCK